MHSEELHCRLSVLRQRLVVESRPAWEVVKPVAAVVQFEELLVEVEELSH